MCDASGTVQFLLCHHCLAHHFVTAQAATPPPCWWTVWQNPMNIISMSEFEICKHHPTIWAFSVQTTTGKKSYCRMKKQRNWRSQRLFFCAKSIQIICRKAYRSMPTFHHKEAINDSHTDTDPCYHLMTKQQYMTRLFKAVLQFLLKWNPFAHKKGKQQSTMQSMLLLFCSEISSFVFPSFRGHTRYLVQSFLQSILSCHCHRHWCLLVIYCCHRQWSSLLFTVPMIHCWRQ